MGDSYGQMLKDDRGFVPGRPVVSNPYSILPQDMGNLSSVNLLEDRLSVPIGNLFYACYELVMQILSRLMMHIEETEAQLALQASVSMDLMMDCFGLWEQRQRLSQRPKQSGYERRAKLPIHPRRHRRPASDLCLETLR